MKELKSGIGGDKIVTPWLTPRYDGVIHSVTGSIGSIVYKFFLPQCVHEHPCMLINCHVHVLEHFCVLIFPVEEDECELEWHVTSTNRQLPASYTPQSLTQRTKELFLCMDTCGDQCAGVNYNYNSGLCGFSNYNRATLPSNPLVSVSGGYFVEKYCSSKLFLFTDLNYFKCVNDCLCFEI